MLSGTCRVCGGGKGILCSEEKTFTLSTVDNMRIYKMEGNNTVVRRLTPVEAERLQGFLDGYTNIPWANKPTAPDSRRYKALGNSMAVPVMRWIGKRIMETKKVVYNAEAIRKVMLPPLSHDEIKTGQQMLF